MLVIVNYGLGNLGSILNMLKKGGVRAVISSDVGTISQASKLILPGVGAFDSAMSRLAEAGFVEVLNKKVRAERTPVLGICLGLQLLTKGSREGALPGLGWIDAETVKFDFGDGFAPKVPHMGWSNLHARKSSRLLEGLSPDARAYFVHSYHLKCADQSDVLLSSVYGYEFVCAVERENILGVQFHPEKSHAHGMRILQNFARSY